MASIQIVILPEETKKPPSKWSSEGSLSNLLSIVQKLIATSSILEYRYLCYMCLRHLKGHDSKEWVTTAFLSAYQLFFFFSANNNIKVILEYWFGGELLSLTRRRETELFLWVGTIQLCGWFSFLGEQKLLLLSSSPPNSGQVQIWIYASWLNLFSTFCKDLKHFYLTV